MHDQAIPDRHKMNSLFAFSALKNYPNYGTDISYETNLIPKLAKNAAFLQNFAVFATAGALFRQSGKI